LFPISIRLREFGRSPLFWEGEGNAANLAKYIASIVAREYEGTGISGSIQHYIIELLTKGGAIIVMDGLDELPGKVYDIGRPEEREVQQSTESTRMRLQKILNNFTEHALYGRCRVVVTSRSYAYRSNSEWRLGSCFAEAHLRDFEPRQIQEYIKYWHIQIAERRIKQNQSNSNILRSDVDANVIEATVSSFWKALEKNKQMLELARRPLILTFIVSRYSTDTPVNILPSVSKVQLYGEIVRMLTKFWSQHQLGFDDPKAPTTLVEALGLQNDKQLELLLAVVAFEAHKGMENSKDTKSAIITSDTLKNARRKIGTLFKGDVRSNVWMQLRDRTGILLPYRTDEYELEYFAFTHTSFQEWLAAKAIISRSPDILPIDYWPPEYRQAPLNLPDLVAGLIQIAHERWREVIVLILESTIYDESNTTWQIIQRLVSESIQENNPEDSRWYGALLAGDFLERNKDTINITGRPEPEAVKKQLVRSLQHQAMSIEDRVEVGRILSVLGDERVQLKPDFVPPLNKKVWHPERANNIDNLWVQVPDTTILLGSPPQDVDQRPDERRPIDCKREIQGFYISRYHVTNEMFQQFIEHGYDLDVCWDWSDRSRQWHDSNPTPGQSNQMLLGNAPCLRVSWCEAVAFCIWLTKINPFKLDIFLPSESEWLAAACSDPTGRFHDTIYVWGNSIDGDSAHMGRYGNIRRLKLNEICSVGIFQPNRLGIFDMSGNILEWTRSRWRPDLTGVENNALDYNPRIARAVRGCSYLDIDANIRVGRRRDRFPEQRYDLIGFRIAARMRNQ
jgi:formylglycine-generating enzyme required for sulfatase activity